MMRYDPPASPVATIERGILLAAAILLLVEVLRGASL